LRELLSQETLAWTERSPAAIVAELAKPQTYRRGADGTLHEIEVTLLDATDDYIHVKTSINDVSLVWALTPSLDVRKSPASARRCVKPVLLIRTGHLPRWFCLFLFDQRRELRRQNAGSGIAGTAFPEGALASSIR
jgi:hypothetical protein